MIPMTLQARELEFTYRTGGHPVIGGFSSDFKSGSLTAVVGTSGAGKSSLLFLLGLMLTPSSGGIYFDGEPVSNRSDRERSWLRAHEYGFVFQDAALDNRRTVIDNVLLPLSFRNEKRSDWFEPATQLLSRVGVTVPLNRRPGEVSGGQAQRIALCRALLASPRIILADEPTGNLDAESAEVVMRELEYHANKGAIVVVVTHSTEVETRCDQTVRLVPVSS